MPICRSVPDTPRTDCSTALRLSSFCLIFVPFGPLTSQIYHLMKSPSTVQLVLTGYSSCFQQKRT